jgi:hypothetical protein
VEAGQQTDTSLNGASKENGGDGTTMGTAMATENDEPQIPDDRPLLRTL